MANHDINHKHHVYWNMIYDPLKLKIEYLDTVWKYFSWEKVNFANWYRDNVNEQTPSDQVKYLKKTEAKIQQLFPHNFLSTNLTQIYTILEVSLGHICYELERRKKIVLSEEEKGKIKKTKDNFLHLKILLKHLDFSIVDLNPMYNEIRQFQKLRNCIAHQGDRIAMSKPDDSSFRNFLQNLDGVNEDDTLWIQEGGLNNYIIASDYPNKRLFNISLEFFRKLLELSYPTDDKKLWEE